MRKFLVLILIICLLFTLCCGCKSDKNTSSASNTNIDTSTYSNNSDSNISSNITSKEDTTSNKTETFTSSSDTNKTSNSTTSNTTKCSHEFSKATCEEAAKCIKCGATQGTALGHNFIGNICSRCSITKGDIFVESILLEYRQKGILVGEDFKLNYTYSPDNAKTPTLSWKSDNPNIAKVDNSGNVTGISVGETYITVTTDNGKSNSCKFIVEEDLLSKCNLICPETPIEVSYRSYTKVSITKIAYKFQLLNDGSVILHLSFSGEKTYDSRGETGTTMCIIQYKIYDSENIVVDSNYISTPQISVGDKFANCSDYVANLVAGTYRIEFF